jgi:hypothetical protein
VLNLVDVLSLDLLLAKVLAMCVMNVIYTHLSTTLFDVIGSTEENIHFLEGDFAGFWDEEDNVKGEDEVDYCEEEECFAVMLLALLQGRVVA